MNNQDSSGSKRKQNLTSMSSPKPKQGNHSYGARFFQSWGFIFTVFFGTHLLAAQHGPILDCDEVFNYWEPTHYLNHRYGRQTWEYAPEFSIRSWLYIVIHAIIGKLGSLLSSNKNFEFYFVRGVLALACAAAETRLFLAISKILNPRIAIIFMLAMISSPGMFHASVAYLPSSFSMYCAMLGMAAFMNWRGGLKIAEGIMWFGIGALVGWPFSAVLIVPFVLEDLFLASLTGERSEVAFRYLDGIVRCIIVLALQISIDTFFYHKIVVIPWRMVMYNVFSGAARGPNIFGTEPWDFYVRNLLLNFNVWFILAMASGPLFTLDFLTQSRSTSKRASLRSVVFVTPFYIWLAIFSGQPHKEERFMYPAYPFLCLNAAITLHILLSYFGNSDPKKITGKIPATLKLALVSSFVLFAVMVGVSRSIGIVSAYGAPLHVYGALRQLEQGKFEETLCIAKEWYRFPSSYFLPKSMRAKFVKSSFDGLLPGEFNEAKIGFGFFPGTWLDPPGMNDLNIEDPGKYFDINHCSLLVDAYFPETPGSSLEPHYVLDEKTWEKVECSDFLDASKTSLMGRTLWIPNLEIIPVRHRRRWGRYCLLRRKHDA